MLFLPAQDLDRRTIIWSKLAEPLFDFVFDEGTLESDYRRIGRTGIELGYSDEELATIYWYEVFPAIAGSWIAIDPLNSVWLQQRIQNRPIFGFFLTLVFRPWWVWVGWDCWREIKKGIKFGRTSSRAETEQE